MACIQTFDFSERCKHCNLGKTCTWKCNSCCLMLCDNCIQKHKADNHQIQHKAPVDDYFNRTPSAAMSSSFSSTNISSNDISMESRSVSHVCRILDQNTFCQKCLTAICDTCSRTKHQTHIKIPLEEAKIMAKANSSNILSKLEDYNNVFQREYECQIRYMDDKIALENLKIKDDVDMAFLEIYNVLEIRKKEIHSTLDQILNTKYELLKKHSYNMLAALQESRFMMENCKDKLTKRTNEVEFLKTISSVQIKLNEYDLMLKNIHSTRADNIGFRTLHNDLIQEFVSKIGDIYVKEPNTNQVMSVLPLKPAPVHSPPKKEQYPGSPTGKFQSVTPKLYSSVASFRPSVYRITYYKDEPNNWFYNIPKIPKTILDPFKSFMSNIGRPIFNVAHEVSVEIPLLTPETFGTSGAKDTEFCRPWGICSDCNNNLYIADRSNNRVQIFSSNGEFIRKFGQLGQCPGEFDKPAGICLDPKNNIFVADKDNHRIQVFDEYGNFLRQFGQKGTRNGQFNYPWDVAVNSRNEVAVSDSRNYRVQLFSQNGDFLNKFCFQLGSASLRQNDYVFPRGLCFTPFGFLMVTDFNKHNVVVIEPSFRKSYTFGEEGRSIGYISRPQGIICDDKGRIVISDSKNNRVQLINSNGQYIVELGGNGCPLGQLDRPCGVTVLTTGRIAVVDFGNSRIMIF